LSVPKALADSMGDDFYNADDFHPSESVAKIASRIPLNDSNRAPWLALLHEMISASPKADCPSVLVCFVLEERYRQQLLHGNDGEQIVYHKGSYVLIGRVSLKRWNNRLMRLQ